MARAAEDVQVVDDPGGSRFELQLGDDLVGYAEYEAGPERVVLTHTVVDPSHEGHGYGSRLAGAALEAVRGSGRTVVPQCPFVADYIERHPEYADLVTP